MITLVKDKEIIIIILVINYLFYNNRIMVTIFTKILHGVKLHFFLVDIYPYPGIFLVQIFGHEVDLEAAGKFFPEDIILGNIEPAILQFGTPRKVYDLCQTAIEKGKKAPGGFILGPGCTLPPLAPPVNVFAMAKAVNDFGWYE